MKLYSRSYEGKYETTISNWGDREFCEKLKESIDIWLDQFDLENKKIMYKLLKNFSLYRGKYLENSIKKLFSEFEAKYTNWKTNTLIFQLKSDSRIYQNSENFWFKFKICTDTHDYIQDNIFECYNEHSDVYNKVNTIVFIDDFIGSGRTFLQTLIDVKNFDKDLFNKHIVVLAIHVMYAARLEIAEFANKHNLLIDVIYCEESDKAFACDNIYSKKSAQRMKDNSIDICRLFKINGCNEGLGFDDSQSLIAFGYNTPNNTLNAFSKDSDIFKALFPRKVKKQPEGLAGIIYNDEKNKKIKHELKFVKSSEDESTLLFARYCCEKKYDLDITDACAQFGFSKQQFENKIEYCLTNGLLESERNKYVPGKKLTVNLLKSHENSTEKQIKDDIIKYTPSDCSEIKNQITKRRDK